MRCPVGAGGSWLSCHLVRRLALVLGATQKALIEADSIKRSCHLELLHPDNILQRTQLDQAAAVFGGLMVRSFMGKTGNQSQT